MTEITHEAAEAARLARVAATDAAHAFGRTLADQHLSHADLIRISGISPSIVLQLDSEAALAAGEGLALLGLEAYAAEVHAAMGEPPFTGPYGFDEALRFLDGVRAVKQATDNGYRVQRP